MRPVFVLPLLLLAASTSHAAVVYSGTQNVAVPLTIDGVYLNVFTGATAGTEPGTWASDSWINPFLGGTAINNSAGLRPVITGADQVVKLTLGTLIDGSSNFVAGESVSSSHVGGAGNQFTLGVPGYLGFEFEPTTGGSTYYGWLRLTISNSGAGTVHDWAYESAPGSGITAGAVPEPGSVGLLLLGGWVVGLRRRRR